MKTKLILLPCLTRRNSFRRSAIITSLLAVAALLGQNVRGADVTWTGGPLGLGNKWQETTNWDTVAVPGSSDKVIFTSNSSTNLTTYIDMVAAAGVQHVGAVTVSASRLSSMTVRIPASSTASGSLVLHGAGGVLLANATTFSGELIFQNASSGTGTNLSLGIAASGSIYAEGDSVATVGRISIYASLNDYGGSYGINKTGPGSLYLRSDFDNAGTYSGPLTVSQGDLQVTAASQVGNGKGTIYLSGGNLHCGGSKNGTSAGQEAIPNPISLTQNAYIFNNTGTAGSTRYLALSGPLGGSGTLTIANPTTVVGEIFATRFFGGFTNSLNVKIGETDPVYYQDNPACFSVLEMANYATNGLQVWNGTISSIGAVRRTIGGTAIVTGNNTYSGGTSNTSGILLANNTAGSALGSGPVLVATNGTLGGSGAIVAATTVNYNGIISPGATTNGIANLAVSALTFGPGANYVWQITSATGSAGTAWDLITCSSGWTDAGNSGNPITIKVDSLGVAPTGWSSSTARDWVIISSGTASGFNAANWALDTTGFSGTKSGIFSLSVVSGSLHLLYTPAPDIIINVPSGSQTQGSVSPTPYPLLTGAVGVMKVGNGEVVLTNPLNDYQGSTKIYAGTASAAVDALNGTTGAFGNGTEALLLGNTLGNTNATLNISVAGVTLARAVVVQSGSSGVKTIGTTITSGTANYVGDVSLQDSVTLSALSGGSDLFSGNFSGTGGITFGGSGTITMSALNSYTGPTLLTGGNLNLNAKALGTNTFTISATSTLDNTSGGSVTLNSCPMNWNADFTFTGSSSLNLGDGAVAMNASRKLTVNGSTLTVGGTIAGVGFSLTKAGAGELLLSGSTNSTYTGGTTNLAGILAIGSTATFGDGTGPLVLAGGNLLSTGSRMDLPIANPVQLTVSTRIYGNSSSTPPSSRYLPFTGPFTVTGGASLIIDNTGLATNTFFLRLVGSNYTTVNWPIVIGDAGFDTVGALCQLDLYNDNTAPVQTVSGLITGTGSLRRSASTLNTGGTSILTAPNTYSGGTELNSGGMGLGVSSVSSGGVVLSGPLGTGTFTLGANNNEASVTLFASGGARVLDNRIVLNGMTNVIITGTNDLTLTGPFNSGGVAKTLTVQNNGITTISGVITNTGSSAGGALTKVGSGILVLSGNNTYPGTTTVNDGSLFINNTAGSGTSTNTVTVNSPGLLGGTGTIAGPVSATAGGSIAPGFHVGTLTLQNGCDLTGGTMVWTLGANSTNNAGTDFSQLALTSGTLNLSGSTLTLAFTNTATVPASSNPFWQANHVWRIVTLSGGATISGGNFGSVNNGSYPAGTFATSTDANGVLLTFTATAAPATAAALGRVSLSGNVLSLYLTNGSPGSAYQIVTATNVTQSIATWLPATNGNIAGNGTATNSLGVISSDKARFYRVKQ